MKKRVSGIAKRVLCMVMAIMIAGSGVTETIYAAPVVDQMITAEAIGETGLQAESAERAANTGEKNSQSKIVETAAKEISGNRQEADAWEGADRLPNYGYVERKKDTAVESIYALPLDEVGTMEDAVELPERYVNENLPNTRDQGGYGTCWAHSSIAVVEANMMKQGMIEEGESEVDTSELHLAYFAYHTAEDPLGGIKEDRRSVGTDGENYLQKGGNAEQATRTLFAWFGAADEDTAPYSECDQAAENGLDHSIAFQDIAHIKNAYTINPRSEREEAKRLVYEYGALTASYLALQYYDRYETEDGTTYTFYDFYNKDNKAYYCPVLARTNHAVTIVGWDDNFSKENFSIQPEGDGAWLIRNSWTTSNAQSYNGYFWMSYYDQSLWPESYAYEMMEADQYDNNYQYDGTYFSNSSSYDICANVFEVKAGEQGESLEAIAFETDNTNLDYVVEIYTHLEANGDPSTGRLSLVYTGETKYAGYHTVELPRPVTLDYGERIAVVVKLIKDDYWVGVKYEDYYEDDNFLTIPKTGAGKSYYYQNGQWNDRFSGDETIGNFCIKAYTKNFEERVEANDILLPDIPAEGLTLGVEEEYFVFATPMPVNAADKTVVV